MDRSPPNIYIDYRLSQLFDAMMDRAGKLLKEDRVGRRDLAYLLIASAQRLGLGQAAPNSPHNQIAARDSSAVQAFGPLVASETRAARWRLLSQARDALQLPPNPQLAYFHEGDCDSDDACLAAMARMDEAARRLRADGSATP